MKLLGHAIDCHPEFGVRYACREAQIQPGKRTHKCHVQDVDHTTEVAHKSMSYIDIRGESEVHHLFRAPGRDEYQPP